MNRQTRTVEATLLAHSGMPHWLRRKAPASDPDEGWSKEMARIKAAEAERAQRLVGQEARVAQLERLLFDHDPI
jgi:hypothetical protein